MEDREIDVLKIETEKKRSFKNLPLSFKIIAIILIIILFFIPVVFI